MDSDKIKLVPGLALVDVLPPKRGLRFGLLQAQLKHRETCAVFNVGALCQECAVTKDGFMTLECDHSDEQRTLRVSVTFQELALSFEHGYKLINTVEVC